jgi:mRNA interferase RelE/StbE
VYRLLFHPDIEKQLSRIPRVYAERLAQTIRKLRNDPRPNQSKHLDQELYRLREGDYRILYAVFDSEQVVYVGKVERRSERTYRDIARLLARARQVLIENGE